MTTKYPRVGDKVRVTQEGTVTRSGVHGFTLNDGEFEYYDGESIDMKVEVLEPARFPSGTMFRSKNNPQYLYVRTESGYYDVFGQVHYEHPLRLERDVQYGTLEVVYEPATT